MTNRPRLPEPARRSPDRPADVYPELREAIASGRFHPNQRLVEADLAAAFGAGRTSIRSALATLDREGLVVREPHRGARVRLISDREAIEIEQVRNALERLIARIAGTRVADEDLVDLRAIVAEMVDRVSHDDALGYSALNARFHQRIWAIADNQLASRLLGTLKSQSIRFQYRTMLRPGRAAQSLREHQAIVAALEAHDPDACEGAMADHLGHVVDTLRWAIESQPRQPAWAAAR